MRLLMLSLVVENKNYFCCCKIFEGLTEFYFVLSEHHLTVEDARV